MEKRLSGATDDYLRLRHKAKEAHAVSAEEQRQCGEEREKVSGWLLMPHFILSLRKKAGKYSFPPAAELCIFYHHHPLSILEVRYLRV